MSDDTLSMLADAAAGFAKRDPARVRRLRGTEPGFDRQHWREIADQGWLSILVAEADGGLGLGIEACCVIAEKLGAVLVPEPFVGAGVMAPLALACGDHSTLRARALAEIMGGETMAALAWQNHTGQVDTTSPAVTVMATVDGDMLGGVARFVVPAVADAYIVAASSESGTSLHWVERDAAGLAITLESSTDGSRQARLNLENVRASPANRVAGPLGGEDLLRRVVDAGVLVTAAELAGVMQRMLAMTLEYLRTRQQFGKPIGSFQGLQHRCVDLWVQSRLVLAAVRAAARVFDNPEASVDAVSSAASGAKSRASDAALLIGRQAIQMHGAIGVTDEYDLGLYVNRALTLAAWLGNGAAHRRRYGEFAAHTDN